MAEESQQGAGETRSKKIDELERLRLENEALKMEKDRLREAMDNTLKTGKVSIPVSGVYMTTLEAPEGGSRTAAYRFKNGRVRVALSDGVQVGSEALIDLANGKSLPEETYTVYPALKGITPERAKSELDRLIGMTSNVLEEITSPEKAE